MTRRVPASMVAACAGLHRYKKLGETCEEMWRKWYPASFERALSRMGMRSTHEVRGEVRAEIEGVVGDLISTSATTSAEASATFQKAMRAVETMDTNPETRKVATDVLRERVFCGFGTVAEADALAALQATLPCSPHDVTYSSMFGGVLVVGRVDAITDDGSTVVEIKNRINRLLGVPLYERIQLLTYLELLDKPRGALVERHGDDVMVHFVERDSAWFFEEVVPRLQAFGRCVARLEADEAFADRFLLAKRRTTIIKREMASGASLGSTASVAAGSVPSADAGSTDCPADPDSQQ